MRIFELTEANGDNSVLAALSAKYNEYNQKFYRGALPKIPMRWGNLKRATAHVAFKTMRPTGYPLMLVDGSMEMVFSNKYKRSAEDLFPVLLHEMVHVYLVAVAKDFADNHGPAFHQELARLTSVSGVDIPLTDTAKDLELNEPLKTYGVVVRYINKGQIAYAMFTENIILTKLDEIKARWGNDRYEKVEARLVTSELWTAKAAKMRLQRNIGYKTSFWIAAEEDAKDLLANSKLLWANKE